MKNALFSVEVPAKGVAKGHVHYTLTSRAPADVSLTAFCANISASLLFERLEAQGTNIIVQLGEKNSIDVLARFENDGVNLLWPAKPADANQLNEIAEKIKNKTFFIGKQPEKTAPTITTKPVPNIVVAADQEHMSEEQEDYLVKQLHRIP